MGKSSVLSWLEQWASVKVFTYTFQSAFTELNRDVPWRERSSFTRRSLYPPGTTHIRSMLTEQSLYRAENDDLRSTAEPWYRLNPKVSTSAHESYRDARDSKGGIPCILKVWGKGEGSGVGGIYDSSTLSEYMDVPSPAEVES